MEVPLKANNKVNQAVADRVKGSIIFSVVAEGSGMMVVLQSTKGDEIRQKFGGWR